MAEIKETAVTFDHETGRVRIDTTSGRIRTLCLKAGMKDITKGENLGNYWSFEGTKNQIRLSRVRKGVSGRPFPIGSPKTGAKNSPIRDENDRVNRASEPT